MKTEAYIKDPKPYLELKSKLWSVFDILRSESTASENYYVVLFLLSLVKDKFVTPELLAGEPEIKAAIDALLKSDHGDDAHLSQYKAIYPSFKAPLKAISNKGLAAIFKVLCEPDHEALIADYPLLFDEVLYSIAKSQGRFGGEFIQPHAITRLICGLAELPENAKVYNPFAGLASFAIELDNVHEYFGQEVNQKIWAIGALRIMAYERQGSSRYVLDDSILNWPDNSEKYDLVLANPPYNMRLAMEYREDESGMRTIEHFLIKKGISSLNDSGKLIAILPQGFLYNEAYDYQLRKYLIDEDLLDTVITLPGGLLTYTGISLVIIVIDKNKKRPGMVRLIDGSKFVRMKGSREKLLDAETLIHFIQTPKRVTIRKTDDNCSVVNESLSDYHRSNEQQNSGTADDAERMIHAGLIKEMSYGIHAPRFFQKQIDGVQLREILENIQGSKEKLPVQGKLIRIRDLKDDSLDFKLELSGIENTVMQAPNTRVISQTCLLIASRWKNIKPTFFEYTGEPVILNQDIFALKVNEELTYIPYLINELHADYVEQQLASLRTGATIPIIKLDDLLNAAIKLPPVAEQKAKIKGIVEISNKIQLLQDERNALAHGVSARLYENISTIKHSLGKPLLNIGSSLRNIEKALSKMNSDWERVKLNERYDLTIKDSFDSVYSHLKLIHSILKNNVTDFDVNNYELKEVDFVNFIQGYVYKIQSAERSNVSTRLDIHSDIRIQMGNKVLVQANAELLEIGLNAIVENANNHAFIDPSKKYKLEFRVSLFAAPGIDKKTDGNVSGFDTHIKVEVANNGKPFPKNYTLEKLTRKNSFAGETGNTGQGGFDLNEIIKYHNNGVRTLELLTDDSTNEFTTTYSFLIPFNR